MQPKTPPTINQPINAVRDRYLTRRSCGSLNFAERWNDYLYDFNGNMTVDKNKGLTSIQYNHLNLPIKIIGLQAGDYTEYIYNALGEKLGKRVFNNNLLVSEKKYRGEVEINQNELSFIHTSEGYIDKNPVTGLFQYNYYIKDHLGSIREVFKSEDSDLDGYPDLLAENHYYPFGMILGGLGYETAGTDNQYLYNGKELQDDNISSSSKLNWLDYGARFYDPALGRWHSVDPHAENYYSWSSYHYVANNPLAFTDPTGMDWYKDEKGNTMWRIGSAEIDGYENLGANYTQNIGNGVSITFVQNEATSMTTNTMTSDQWVSQYSKSDWDGTPASKACNKASDAMLAKDGNSSSGMTVVVNNAGDGRAGTANGNATNAISDMSKALDFDKPTKVNVDFRSGTGSRDKMGDHFVVVQGKTEQLSNGKVTSTTFHYFDPGTNHQSKGTSSSNILRVQNNRLVGTHMNNGLPIVVTSIRPTR